MAAWGVLLTFFFWTYWQTFHSMVRVWATTPDYEHGFFVPIFAAFLLWYRQEMVDPWPDRGTWWGIPFFVLFAVIRWLCLYFNYERDIDSLLPFLAGMTLILGGWRALRWAWPSIVFLIFMVPLPDFLTSPLRQKLQHAATLMTTYVLVTVGIPAIAMGNVIQLSKPEDQLEIERSCSGLKMMVLFFALCVGTSFVLRAPLWKKIVLIISAVPIAIVSNVLRITVTGMLYEWWSKSAGDFFHDYTGWVMMIWAMLMIWGEMALLSALLSETPIEGPLAFGGATVAARRRNPLAGPVGFGPPPDKPRGSPRL